jgi:hypothetical protein
MTETRFLRGLDLAVAAADLSRFAAPEKIALVS